MAGDEVYEAEFLVVNGKYVWCAVRLCRQL
jgi:hypothetical protein